MSTANTIDPAAVLKLPPAQKRDLLLALAREMPAVGPLDLGDGIVLYRPVPNARQLAEESFRNETPEGRSERRAATPEDSVSVEQMMKLIEEDMERDEK